MKNKRDSLLIVLSGPSGVGKQTVAEELLKIMPELKVSISATTRKSRDGEVDGVNYFFLDRETFEKLIKEKYFIEYAEIHNNLYGTPVNNIKDALLKNEMLLLVIDIQGGKKVKEAYPFETLLFFLQPPSFSDLYERLKKRGTETDEEIKRRLKTARVELSKRNCYDYIVINDDPKRTAIEIRDIVLRRKRNES